MSKLIKTEAVVLRKIDFGDTSKIATLYTEELGKIPVIIKGGRTSKSKIGMIVDPLNIVQVVLHNKESREVQLVTQADLVLSPTVIKSDLDRMKYSAAASELVFSLIPEHDPNERLYKGLRKINFLMNDESGNPKILFVRFFLFFLKEIGYEIQLNKCSDCGSGLDLGENVYFSFQKGILCGDCKENHVIFSDFTKELLNNLACLSSRNNDASIDLKLLDKTIMLLEKYLSYHVEEFKGLRSLNIYKLN